MGIVMCELLHHPFTRGLSQPKASGLPKLWKLYLGRTIANSPVYTRKPWPANFKRDIGLVGLELLEMLLDFEPRTRVKAAAALNHPFFNQDRFALMGYPPDASVVGAPDTPIVLRSGQPGDVVQFSGKRHEWNMLAGQMSPEVLSWYNGHKSMEKGTPENELINACFEENGENKKFSEVQQVGGEDMKLVITGGLRRDIGDSLFGKEHTRPCPNARASAYVEAFKKCNRASFCRMQAEAVPHVRKLTYAQKDLHNGKHFLTKTIDKWLLASNQLTFTKRKKADGTLLAEPKHPDGSTSVLHLGIGTAGRRDLVCDQVAAAPQVVLKNFPGTVYLGQLTGPMHQVFHQPCPDDELIDATKFGPTSSTLMCRTALFPHLNSRKMDGYVHTPALFTAMQQTFTAGLRSNAFRLPNLAECKEAESKLHLTLPCPADAVALKNLKQRRRHHKLKSKRERTLSTPQSGIQSKKAAVAKKSAPDTPVAVVEAAPMMIPKNRMTSKGPFVGVYVE